MNVENENIEPVTELGLALDSNQCTQRRLNSISGAGANAGLRVDMKYVATDPLSELVWSPQNGLSLKCADSSFVNKKTSLLWGTGPSNVVISSLNITAGRSSTDKPINEEENCITSQGTFHQRNEIAGRNISGWTPGSDVAVISDTESSHEDRTGTLCFVPETNTLIGLSLQHIDRKEEIRNGKGECIAGPSNMQMAKISEAEEKILSNLPADLCADLALYKPLSEDPTGGGKDVACGNQSRMEIVLSSGFHHTKECEGTDTFTPNLTSPGKRCEESAFFLEKETKNKTTMTNSISIHPLEKLESTSDNNLRTFSSKSGLGAANRIVASESAHKVKNASQQDKETIPRENPVSEHSPSNCKMWRYQRKGKEKALSDGDVYGRMSKEDDDSQESVESCNCAKLFSTGKKRWSFEQQLIAGSKNVKKKIQESPGSTSFIKQDSSFMNWISNMLKGFSNSNIDDARAPSLALTLAHRTHGHEIPDQKLIMNNKNQESGCRNVGFQSIFQSLYCPKMKGDQRALDDGYKTKLEVVNQLFDISPIPLACHTDNDKLCEQFLLSNEKFNESSSGEGAGTATQPKTSFVNFASSLENRKSAENKNSFNLATNEGKGGTDSNSSLGKRKMSSTENTDSEPLLKVKTTYNFVYGSNPLGSSWITRFSPKTYFPLLKLDNQNQRSGGPLECSTSCQKLIPCSQTRISSSNDLKIVDSWPQSNEDPPTVVGKELQNSTAETDASSRFNVIKVHNNEKSVSKLNLIAPSSKLKNSEAMASVFARRLDALKQIMPSDSAACATSSCFYCGSTGHHLQDCLDITDSLKNLQKNIKSYNGVEELPCLCIRCFQFNHSAVACPNASSRGQNQLEGNDFSPNEMLLSRRKEESTKLLDGNKRLAQAAGTHTVCDQNNPQKDTDLEINHKLNQVATFDRMVHNANLVKHFISSGSGGQKLRENRTMPFSNYVYSCISEVPKGIFDFIKRIRLSRTDILKWMNYHTSLAHLNGFFLRLRLGKWEEGLGGTGYYVACITGAQREDSIQNSKISIFVNVGGIKFLVEIQYISNQDFLEDELMAWCSAIIKRGGKIPSEEDLRVKVEERKMLGL